VSARPVTAVAGNPGVGSWIERRARIAPDRVALIHGDTRRTYAELASRVRRLAHGLQSIGVEKGDRVGWLGPNHPAFLETLFASAMLGAVMTPINHRLESGLMNAIGDDVAAGVLFVDRSLADGPLPRAVGTKVVVGGAEDAESDYERLLAQHVDEPIDVTIALDELCLLAFTSGTTSAPKGVMLSHANVTWNVINCLSCLDLRSDDVTIAVAPFFRTGGTGVTVLPVLFAGGTVVIPEPTDPEEIFHLVAHHRVTIAFGNPDLLDALTRSPLWGTADLTSLRAFVTGGAPVADRLLRTCHERRLPVLQGYGLSEAAPLVSVLAARDAERKAGSAGRPALFVDLRIVDRDGTDSATGAIGELLVRGPNVATGYWNRPEATERAIDARGWLRTGDAACFDEEGFLFIVGRIADAYLSAGKVVHPGVVERVLLQHASVAEACVLGEDGRAVAYLVLKAGAGATVEHELFALCRDQLPVHARPAAIEFVASLPKNPAGKIMRHLLHRELQNVVVLHPGEGDRTRRDPNHDGRSDVVG
jgi:acyl-CoA synthetase (AMP-forming)/AMP-acid ligase II